MMHARLLREGSPFRIHESSGLTLVVSRLVWTWSVGGKFNNYNANSNQLTIEWVARSGVYRRRRPANDNDLDLMRRIDEMFLRWPFLGSRRMAAMLAAEGIRVNRKRVRRLMRLMGVVPLGPRPRTSKPGAGHKIYPYLLRDLVIDRPNQVWCADITYLPLGRGFLYLVAIMDYCNVAKPLICNQRVEMKDCLVIAIGGGK